MSAIYDLPLDEEIKSNFDALDNNNPDVDDTASFFIELGRRSKKKNIFIRFIERMKKIAS